MDYRVIVDSLNESARLHTGGALNEAAAFGHALNVVYDLQDVYGYDVCQANGGNVWTAIRGASHLTVRVEAVYDVSEARLVQQRAAFVRGLQARMQARRN